MSFSDLQSNTLLSSFESAFDIAKILSVFNSLVSVLKNQQDKIDVTERKLNDLYMQINNFPITHVTHDKGNYIGGLFEERIFLLEQKIDTALGSSILADKRLFHDKELCPIETTDTLFESCAKDFNSIFVETAEKSTITETVTNDELSTDFSLGEVGNQILLENPIINIEALPSTTNPHILECNVDSSYVKNDEISNLADCDDNKNNQMESQCLFNTESLSPKEYESKNELEGANDFSLFPTPSDQTSTFLPVYSQGIEQMSNIHLPKEVFIPLSTMTPISPKSTMKSISVESVSNVSILDGCLTQVKRQMSSSNLSLSSEKRARVMNSLFQHGQFIHIARIFQEGSSRKFEALSHRIDCLDAEIVRFHSRIDQFNESIKADNLLIPELLPSGFDNVYKQLVTLLEAIAETGGINNLISKLTHSQDLEIHLEKAINVEQQPKMLQQQEIIKSASLSQYDQNTMIELTRIKNRFADLSSKVVTKEDLSCMITMSSSGNVETEKSVINTDPAHVKLVHLINQCIDRSQYRIDFCGSLRRQPTTVMNVVDISHDNLEEVKQSDQFNAKERLESVSNAIMQVSHRAEENANSLQAQIVLIQDQLSSMQLLFRESATEYSKHFESLQREGDTLKLLQRKVRNMGIEQLFEDLRKIHLEVLERPSSSQITDMMDLVENSIKNHVGENIMGLKGLVEQIYGHIQNKVDKNEIRNLISLKLAQMESELHRKEVELLSVSVTTRCLSCGNKSASSKHGCFEKSKLKVDEQEVHTPKRLSVVNSDINMSSIQLKLNKDVGVDNMNSEQIHSLTIGSNGLKPLLPQFYPMKPVNDSNGLLGSIRKGADRIPEPLYRKAKMAAQLKEMVKITSPATTSYGYGANNPIYVLDGMIYDDDDVNVISTDHKSSLRVEHKNGTSKLNFHLTNVHLPVIGNAQTSHRGCRKDNDVVISSVSQ